MFEDALKTTGHRRQIRGEGADRAGARGAGHRKHCARSQTDSINYESDNMKILVAVKQVAALDEDFEIRADGKDVEADFLRARPERVGRFLARRGDADQGVGRRRRSRWSPSASDPRTPTRRCASAWPRARTARSASGTMPSRDRTRSRSRGCIAAVAAREAPDMLFAGVQSSDHAFASTGIATAALLDWPHAAVVTQPQLYAGRRHRRVPARARGRGVARDADRVPGGADHPAGHQHAALCVAARHQAGRGQADRSAVARRARRARRCTSARAGRSRACGACTYPRRGAREMIEGSVEEQAARLAQIIKERAGGAA